MAAAVNWKSWLIHHLKGGKAQAEPGEGSKRRRYLVSLLMLLPVIALTFALFLFKDRVIELGNWGYLGAFLIGLIGNATVVLPMPGLLLLFALGATFNPILVGLVGAVGGAIGETSGYLVGYSGHAFISNSRMYLRAEGWMRRWGAAAIFVFSLVPFLPFDIAGIAAGVLRFPLWKFIVACWLGKAVLYISLASISHWGWEAAQRLFG
jgi:uncharacterized membrane protein YdjX (TVP38/TMEM64 family)